ncbi:serine/threonine-protein kinase Nek4 isoform X1 [Silurus meridionalis]|nr:serine/threonine-protein kinase Nek4 isoform X1 [Silurus meridionalis]
MESYVFLRVVGKGSYGEVNLVQHKSDRKQVRHPNIVTYLESWKGNGQLFIVMGFCEGGDLYSQLRQQNGELLPERQVVEWFVQIAMALQYLHKKRILHRDLKTRNIFLTDINIIKVGDLGFAHILQHHDTASTLVGTPLYMSPELILNKPYDYKYVIKKLNLRTSSKRERRAAEQEAQLLSQLKHPNIVTYRESWEGKDHQLYIVMGFCEGGDLYHRLKQQNGELLPERQVVDWFVQIATALQEFSYVRSCILCAVTLHSSRICRIQPNGELLPERQVVEWFVQIAMVLQYVIKKLNLRTSTKRERQAAEQEAQLLSQLKHPNIGTYRESWEGKDHQLYIVMGFCEGGDLYHRLKQQKNKLLAERQVVEWFVQITMALQRIMESYVFLRVVGKGSYGEVNLVQHKSDRKQYVIKKLNLRTSSKRERRAAEQEAQLLSQLKLPNIVTYWESWEGKDHQLYIVMGFCEGGDLYHRLKQQKNELLPERQVVEWFVQIAIALQYLHNIFLTKTNIIKVGDLGIARVLENQNDMASTLIGTPYYMSPELFSNKPYNYKSDVWALGCCVYEMATLKHAFNAKDMNSLVYCIVEGKLFNWKTAKSRKKVNSRPSRDAPEVPLVQKQESQYVNSELKSRGNRDPHTPEPLASPSENSKSPLHPLSSSFKSCLSRQSREKKGEVAREESKMKAANSRPLPPLRKKVTFVGINRIEGGEAEMVKHPPPSQADHQHEPAQQNRPLSARERRRLRKSQENQSVSELILSEHRSGPNQKKILISLEAAPVVIIAPYDVASLNAKHTDHLDCPRPAGVAAVTHKTVYFTAILQYSKRVVEAVHCSRSEESVWQTSLPAERDSTCVFSSSSSPEAFHEFRASLVRSAAT